jgi:hypothetical protein
VFIELSKYDNIKKLLTRISGSDKFADWEKPIFPGILRTPIGIVEKLLNLDVGTLAFDLLETEDYQKVIYTATVLNKIRNDYAPWSPGDPIPSDWFEPVIRGGTLSPIYIASLALSKSPDEIISDLLEVSPIMSGPKKDKLLKEDLCFAIEAEIRLLESDYSDIQDYLREAGYETEIADIEQCIAETGNKICNFIFDIVVAAKEKGLTVKEIKERCAKELEIKELPTSLVTKCVGRFSEIILDEKNYKLKIFYAAPTAPAWNFEQKPNGDFIVKNFIQKNVTFTLKSDILDFLNDKRFNQRKAGYFIYKDLITLLQQDHSLTDYLYTFLENEIRNMPKIKANKQYLTITFPVLNPVGWAEYLDRWYVEKLSLDTSSKDLYPRHAPSHNPKKKCKVISNQNLQNGQKLMAPMVNMVSVYLQITFDKQINITLNNIYPGNSIGEVDNPAMLKNTIPRIAFFDQTIEGEPYPELPITKILDPFRKELRDKVIDRKRKGDRDRIIIHQLGISIKTLSEIRNAASEEDKKYFYGGRGSKSPGKAETLAPNIVSFIHRQSATPLAVQPNRWIKLSSIVRYFTLGSEFPDLVGILNNIPELEVDSIKYETKYRDPLVVCESLASQGTIAAVDFAINNSSEQPARRDFNRLSNPERRQVFDKCLRICEKGIIDNPPDIFVDRLVGDIYHDNEKIIFYSIRITDNLRTVGFINPKNKILYLARIFSGSTPSSHIREIAKQHLQRMVK